MELAIPLIALGSLYIVSNQSKPEEKKKEGFDSLPNTNVPDKNFPDDIANNRELDVSSKLATVNQYDGRSAYTDKYFNLPIHAQGWFAGSKQARFPMHCEFQSSGHGFHPKPPTHCERSHTANGA